MMSMAMRNDFRVPLFCALFLSFVSAETKKDCLARDHFNQQENTTISTNRSAVVRRETHPERTVSDADKIRVVARRPHPVNTRSATSIPVNSPGMRLNDSHVAYEQYSAYDTTRTWTRTLLGRTDDKSNHTEENSLQTGHSDYKASGKDNSSRGTPRQVKLSFYETACTTPHTAFVYKLSLHVPVVLKFQMRKKSAFITKLCKVYFKAPNDTEVSVALLKLSCDVTGTVVVLDSLAHSVKWRNCVRQINPSADWMSEKRRAIIFLQVARDGLFEAKMNVMAVPKPEPGTIQTRYLTPAVGFIQNAGLQLANLRLSKDAVKTNTWSYLVVPGDNVALISVVFAVLGALPAGMACQLRVELYEGSINKTVWRLCSRYRSLPQPHMSYERYLHVHFVFDRIVDELTQKNGFRLIYTFHDDSSIPMHLPTGKWNCSTQTWLSFRHHFICDLVIHCAGGEDEKDCPGYTQCGHNGVLLSGKCFWLSRVDSGATWHQANAMCYNLGLGGHLGLGGYMTYLTKFLRQDLVLESGQKLFLGATSAATGIHL